MNSETPLTRRGWLAAIGGCAGVGAVAGFAARFATTRTFATPLPPLVLPPTITGLKRLRLQKLHDRYSAARTSGGASAMRNLIVSDLRGFVGQSEWQQVIGEWIERASWNDAADLLVDSAELGDADVRRNAAARLSSKSSPLLLANGYTPRIIHLHLTETDPIAKEYWRDLRKLLGI